jgi:hypothetical protein
VLIGGHDPQELVTFSAGIGGVAVAQTLGPLKRAVSPTQIGPILRLELRAADGGGVTVLRQEVTE